MAGGRTGIIREIDRLFSLGTVGGMTDAQLLALFVAQRDDAAEVAFEALVERHGPNGLPHLPRRAPRRA